MNKERREELQDMSKKLALIKATIVGLRDAEQEYMDNLPKSLQSSKAYFKAEEAVSSLAYAIDEIDATTDLIEVAINSKIMLQYKKER